MIGCEPSPKVIELQGRHDPCFVLFSFRPLTALEFSLRDVKPDAAVTASLVFGTGQDGSCATPPWSQVEWFFLGLLV